MRLTIARRGILLSSIPLVAQLIFGIALIVLSSRAVEDRVLELHSQQVLEKAYQTSAGLVGVEGAVRGYVLTSRREYRLPLDRAVADVPKQVSRLLELVSDNPSQLARVRAMAVTAAAILLDQQQKAAMVDRGDEAEARQLIFHLTGEKMLERFLGQFDGLVFEERRVAADRAQQAAASGRRLTEIVIGGLLLNVFVVLILTALFSGHLNRRLGVLTDNSRRLAAEEPLLPRLSPGDEIADVDRVFREMVESLARTTGDLKHVNEELESFSYSISHDLRAPLRAISGFSHILEEDYGPRLDDEGRRLLAVVRGNAVTMAQLIDDLLAFSHLSRQHVSESVVDLRALAERSFADVRQAAGERDIEFTLGTMLSSRGDAPMLRQVLTNLFSNAVKFTAPMKKALIGISSERIAGENVYSVRDNGVGFDMRYVSKLFGVFQRLHKGSEFEGTGVGLAIVQRVIERHGGRVWAESVLGQGSTFYFTLPVSKEGAA